MPVSIGSRYQGLPDTLSQGLFATPRTYPVLARLANVPGDILPDSVTTQRGTRLGRSTASRRRSA